MEIYRKGFIQTCQAEGRVVRKPRPGRKHMKEPNLDQQSRGEEPRREKPTMLWLPSPAKAFVVCPEIKRKESSESFAFCVLLFGSFVIFF